MTDRDSSTMALSHDDRYRTTPWQRDQLEEVRDCPYCSEALPRTDVKVKDSHVIERYEHEEEDCPYDRSGVYYVATGGLVEHWKDGKSWGTDVFEGEFDG